MLHRRRRRKQGRAFPARILYLEGRKEGRDEGRDEGREGGREWAKKRGTENEGREERGTENNTVWRMQWFFP